MKAADENWVPWVGAPLRAGAGEPVQWAQEADIVVVGFGGAGVCAAIEAAEGGAEVIALDRFAGGGATRLSGGVYYGGGGTRVQLEAGVHDSVENMFRYLRLQTRGAVSNETLRRFCEESNPSLEWLTRHGVPFSGPLYPKKANYPPKGYNLYFSGNERMSGYREHAEPAPRGHRTVHPLGEAGMTGFAFFDPLRKSAEELGVRFIGHAPVARLVVDPEGSVLGVEARVLPAGHPARRRHEELLAKWKPLDPRYSRSRRRVQKQLEELEAREGVPTLIRARKGVVLSSGGFIHNWRMVAAHMKVDHTRTVRMGSPGCDGSGIQLGVSVGGATALMDHCDNGRALRPEIFTQGALLNPAGERFVNEEIYSGTVGDLVVERGYEQVWLVVDKALRDQAIGLSLPGKTAGGFYFLGLPVLLNLAFTTKKGRTIEQLARKLKMDPARVRATIDAYNRAAAGEQPDPFGKDANAMRPLTHGPFYAVNQSPKSMFAPLMAFTTGGLVVDEQSGSVKRKDGTLIRGLYAAGRAAIGTCSESYVSGMSIADCVFSGRRAARNALASIGQSRGRTAPDMPSRLVATS